MTALPAVCSAHTRRDLLLRTQGACIAWEDQPLPRGCAPERARMGVEWEPDGPAALLVDSGVSSPDLDPEVASWLHDGTRRFRSLSDLFDWVDRQLRPTFAPSGGGSQQRAAALTDLGAVTYDPAVGALFLDADELARDVAAEVVGQDRPVATLARRLVEHLAQERPWRPLSMFLVGPTGVGKTSAILELAAAASARSGEPIPFLRIDMGEYREGHRVSQLIGSPPGYIGHGGSTPLLDVLDDDGWAVVLFDEIDKAHPDVWLTIMNALDAGRLTGADGRTRSCRRATFVFTSNRLADEIIAALPDVPSEEAVDQVCRTRFRSAGMLPELVGRLRSFVAFGRPAPEALAAIGVLSIRRAVEAYGLELAWVHPDVVSELLRDLPADGIGVRHVEYRVPALLGPALATEAQRHRGGRVRIDRSADGEAVVEAVAPDADHREGDVALDISVEGAQ